MGASKRRRIEPTHDWQLLLPLFEWPEQERYEQIRPLMLFDVSVAERAAEMGTSTRPRQGIRRSVHQDPGWRVLPYGGLLRGCGRVRGR